MKDIIKNRVTCCVMTYKNYRFLYETLDSIIVQNYSDIEIIVSDDGTENFPIDKINKYISSKRGKNITNVIVYHHSKNIGTVKNYNSIIAKSTGEFIFPVSCGDVLYNNEVISDAVSIFNSSGWDVISFSRMLCTESELLDIRSMPLDENKKNIYSLNTSELQYKSFIGFGPNYEMASGSSTCYKKSVFKEYGMFDERYMLWEDGTFFAHYTRMGGIIHFCYDITYIKYRDGGVSTNRKRKSATDIILKLDSAKMLEIEALPYKERFTKKEIRMIKARVFYNKRAYYNKYFLGLCTLIRYPDCIIDIIKK